MVRIALVVGLVVGVGCGGRVEATTDATGAPEVVTRISPAECVTASDVQVCGDHVSPGAVVQFDDGTCDTATDCVLGAPCTIARDGHTVLGECR